MKKGLTLTKIPSINFSPVWHSSLPLGRGDMAALKYHPKKDSSHTNPADKLHMQREHPWACLKAPQKANACNFFHRDWDNLANLGVKIGYRAWMGSNYKLILYNSQLFRLLFSFLAYYYCSYITIYYYILLIVIIQLLS